MKIKDFIKIEQDIDVDDNVCGELLIAFCGPLELTNEGKEEFAEVLQYEIKSDPLNCCAVVDVDAPNWRHRLNEAKAFFYAAAGYCSAHNYDKWFVEL